MLVRLTGRRRSAGCRASPPRHRLAASAPRRSGSSATPARAMRARSAGAARPLSLTRQPVLRHQRPPAASVVAISVFSVLRLRLLMPMSRVLRRSARSQLVARHAPRPARPCRGHARRLRAPRASSSVSAAMMTRTQSAPIAARLGHLIRIEHEILAQHRQLAGRARRDRDARPRPGNGPRRSAPTGRSRRLAHRRGRARADRNRRG